SSASWWLPSTRRHTPQTIGPCRRTSASTAAASRWLRKHSSSCPSVSVAPSRRSPPRRCRRTSLIGLSAISFPLWASPSYYRHRRRLIHFFSARQAESRHPLQPQLDRPVGLERDRRPRLHLRVRDAPEAVALGDGRQHERRLDQRERVADADAR